MNAPARASTIDPLLHPRDVARILNVSTSWLAKSRLSGNGPRFVKIGRAVRYPEFLSARIHQGTDAGIDQRAIADRVHRPEGAGKWNENPAPSKSSRIIIHFYTSIYIKKNCSITRLGMRIEVYAGYIYLMYSQTAPTSACRKPHPSWEIRSRS